MARAQGVQESLNDVFVVAALAVAGVDGGLAVDAAEVRVGDDAPLVLTFVGARAKQRKERTELRTSPPLLPPSSSMPPPCS